MYNKVECIRITCDNCHDTFVSDYTSFSIFMDESTADDEAVNNNEWYLTDDGKHYCRMCYTMSDEDELVVNVARAK